MLACNFFPPLIDNVRKKKRNRLIFLYRKTHFIIPANIVIKNYYIRYAKKASSRGCISLIVNFVYFLFQISYPKRGKKIRSQQAVLLFFVELSAVYRKKGKKIETYF